MIVNAAVVSLLGAVLAWSPEPAATQLPTSQLVTPTAAPGSKFEELNPGLKDFPSFVAGQPISLARSPDHKTLLVLTSGYNNNYDQSAATPTLDNYLPIIPADSNQYVFVLDVSHGAPVKKQVLQIPNTYVGIAFAPDGSHFYVTGGNDDNLHVFAQSQGAWVEVTPAIALGHKSGNGLAQGPMATGLALTADGKRAVVANRYNDSISLVDLATGTVVDQDLRPGKSGGVAGTPGGEYPNSVAVVGSRTAYVSSERDREIVVVDISGATPLVKARIPVLGNPNRLLLDKAQDTLFAASDNADVVSVISTRSNQVIETVATVGPDADLDANGLARYKGASPNALALSPDERTLYVTNRGSNSVAVIALDERRPRVLGLIPTAWYPSDVVATSSYLYVVNTKSVPGPNPGNCLGYQFYPCPVKDTPVTFEANEYIENLNKGGLQSVPLPDPRTLERLTWQVAENNHLGYELSPRDRETFAALRASIHHVIYIVKENRTYDQILGDLGKGNGDPELTEFPSTTTPNLHAAASQFVTLDNFYDSGEVSGNGWPWSTSARESDAGAKMLPVNYACSPLGGPGCDVGRGGSYDWEGTNRNVNVGLAGAARVAADPLAATLDADTLPGTGNVAAPDGPDGEVQQGYLWSAALRKGLTVRNYGFLIDLTRYSSASGPYYIARQTPPFTKSGPNADPLQAYSANPELVTLTDPYFRGFDTSYPDFYREQEWESEFADFVKQGNLPNLSLVRLMADHTGSYGSAISGVNTPELEVADNDYAVGRVIQAVAQSPYAKDTLIFVVEDDAQDGPDHVDAHRSTAYVVGPYVRQGAVVSHYYTTVNFLRTLTEVLGVGPLGFFDAHAAPMTDVFDLGQKSWTFAAKPSGLLAGTKLPISQSALGPRLSPTHDASYWAAATAGMDFSQEDRLDAVAYNQLLWRGLMAGKPYPATRQKASAERPSASARAAEPADD